VNLGLQPSGQTPQKYTPRIHRGQLPGPRDNHMMRKPPAPRGTGGFPFHCNPRFARDFGLTAEKRSQRDKGSKGQRVKEPKRPHSLLFIPQAANGKAVSMLGYVPIDNAIAVGEIPFPCAVCTIRRSAPPVAEVPFTAEGPIVGVAPAPRQRRKTTAVVAVPAGLV